MPLSRFSGMFLALSYALSCGYLTLVLTKYASALATPLLVVAGCLFLAGSFMVDLPQARYKARAFQFISYGCLMLVSFLAGSTALTLHAQGFGTVSFLHSLVVLFMAYLTGLAFESRYTWAQKALTEKGK